MRKTAFCVFFFSPILMAAPIWQVILEENNKRIELDSTSIIRQGNFVEATGRVVLARPLIDQKTGEEYRIIEAATRYHCDNKSASTLRRIYKRDESAILREENLNVVELPVRAGTLDDKVLKEVCRLNGENAPNSTVNPTKISNSQPENPIKTNTLDENLNKNLEKPLSNIDNKTEKDIRPNFAKPRRTRAKRPQEPTLEQQKDLEELQNVAARLKAANEKLLKEELEKRKPKKVVAQVLPPPAKALKEKNSPKNWHQSVAQSVAEKKGGKASPQPKVLPQTLPRAPHDWAYGGKEGPAHWADLKESYRICRDGLRQSPIDIRNSIKGDLAPLALHYTPSAFRLVDLGYTLSVELENAGFLELENKRWVLQSAEFRRPGEEMVLGKRADMSLHLMHQALDGSRLIVAIALVEGRENPTLQTLWNAIPLERENFKETSKTIDFKNILPRNLGYFTYMGSLTFPPCTENVQWVILKEAQPVSLEQMKNFAFLYPENARPLQANNARIVKESR